MGSDLCRCSAFVRPEKLPELGRAVGKGIREFKRGLNGLLDEEEKKDQEQQT